MNRPSYEALSGTEYSYRVSCSSSQTAFHPRRGTQALNSFGKVSQEERVTRISGCIIPALEVTDERVIPLITAWVKDKKTGQPVLRNWKVISYTDEFIWTM